ncbi:hypothetical protein BDV23DRAFT_154151 [Aspergillus alliaceus]|uniref:Uncharacterized protein n=1 Tax=Petromyces alliaceus TaxID=209559 RepID=A0A5N7C9X1_PETAA|nr:hypothetical protein BDV23DRAFT_154151 [Aspergillus alliaceus]
MKGARVSQVNRFSLDIKRKQVPSVSACRPVENGYRTDPEPSPTSCSSSAIQKHHSGLTQSLEKEVVAALGFSDGDSRSGHSSTHRGNSAELEATLGHHQGNSVSSAHGLASVQPCRDCLPRKPLLKKEESPPMTPIQVAINEAPLLVPEYKSDQRDIGNKILSWEQASNIDGNPVDQQNNVQPQPAADEPPPECNTTTTRPTSTTMGKRYYSSVTETKPSSERNVTLLEPNHNHHRRGSSVQIRLQPMPSVSSLGTLEADRDPQRPLGQVLGQANSSRVSFLSDGGQSLGVHHTRIRDRPKSPWPADEAEHRLSGVFRPLLSGSKPASKSTHHARPDLPVQPASKQAPAPKALSTMDKLKVVGNKIRRPSIGSESGQPHKKALDKISGFFNRSNARAGHDRPESRATESHVPPVQPHRHTHSMDRLYPSSSQCTSHSRVPAAEIDRPRSNIENHTSKGQPPPPEGYFAPESFSRFRDHQEPGVPLTQQITVEDIDSSAPANNPIPSPTEFLHRHSGSGSGNGRLTPQSPPYRPSASPHLSSPPQASPIPSPVPGAPQTPSSRGRSEERTYAQDLNIRSRSPKAFAPRPEERNILSADTSDPAYHLGIFRQNPRTSRIGDQERPWKLTIPGEGEDNNTPDDALTWRQQTTQGVLQCGQQLPTYEEDSREHQHQPLQETRHDQKPPLTNPARPSAPPHSQSTGNLHPTRGESRVLNHDAPVELPVHADDDSSEEITMSSTAYPGQEWRPAGFSGWE